MAVDYLSALGVGAGIDQKAIVDALVEAERAWHGPPLTG